MALVAVPGAGSDADRGRALLAVQEIIVVFPSGEGGDGLAQEVGVDLVTVVEAGAGLG
ncbi:hypothetical protein GTY62_02005 [Streptomyces sp. SID724]|uniref:hypothetical protein n=1 Tax=Streptomyces sp. SID724 TaxID=2690324 RepID=UPI0013612FD5|nr:hypothetical protein [Streptomyces sp. SID724]